MRFEISMVIDIHPQLLPQRVQAFSLGPAAHLHRFGVLNVDSFAVVLQLSLVLSEEVRFVLIDESARDQPS